MKRLFVICVLLCFALAVILSLIIGYPILKRTLEKKSVKLSQLDIAPNGQRLAFTLSKFGAEQRQSPEDNQVYLINLDGSNETQLTSCSNDNRNGTWIDNDTLVLISRCTGNVGTGVYTIHADGSNQRLLVYADNRESSFPSATLTRLVNRPYGLIYRDFSKLAIYDLTPNTQRPIIFHSSVPESPYGAVSADGKQIAFGSTERPGPKDQQPRWNISLMPTDRSKPPQIVYSAEGRSLCNLSWSPSGAQLAFQISHGDCDSGDLWLLDLNTSQSRLLTTAFAETGPWQMIWSPTGANIALTGWVGVARHGGLFVLDLATAELMPLTSPSFAYTATQAVWTPDGRQIVFIGIDSAGQAPPEIFIINADGSRLRQLTHHLGSAPTLTPHS